jgi:hypothetical protein
MKKHLIERKDARQEGKMPVERKARTDGMQGGSNSNKRKCSKKGSANHDVWKLMNAGEIQMEG